MFKKLAMVVALTVTSATQTVWAQEPLSTDQDQKLGEIVEMLKANPDLIGGLHSTLNAYINQQHAFSDLMKTSQPYMTSEQHSFMGAKDAELTIFNVSDYSCPYCKKLDGELEKLVKAFPSLKVVNINVPIKEASSEVNSASFALNVWQNDREKFEEVNALLIAKPGVHNAVSLAKIAKKTGTEQYLKSSDAINEQLARNYALFNGFGLRGTPGLIIGDQLIPGYRPYSNLEKLIKEQLAAKK